MINFSKIPADSFVGRILRNCLRLIPKNSVLPIWQGKLRGWKWIIGSANFGHWLGTYEPDVQKIFNKYIKSGDVVFDIGAHAGFYSLLASKLVGQTGKVFAFEPLPSNILFLKKHIALNKCSNVSIIETAVCDRDGELFFQEGKNTFSGAISDSGKMKVRAVSLDGLLADQEVSPPNFIKIDVEGSEFSVLKGAEKLLKKHHPFICLAIDNPDFKKDCIDLLLALSYELEPVDGEDLQAAEGILAAPR